MQVLGKVIIEGKQKEIILKAEGELFKYYTLELIGAYLPQMTEQEIVFKKQLDNNITKKQILEYIKNNRNNETTTKKHTNYRTNKNTR